MRAYVYGVYVCAAGCICRALRLCSHLAWFRHTRVMWATVRRMYTSVSLILLAYFLVLYAFAIWGVDLLSDTLTDKSDPSLMDLSWYPNRFSLNYQYFHNSLLSCFILGLTTMWLDVMKAALQVS